ncbi:PPC domain-containing protein [Thalassoroseus pseudoceratinae]|uniref:PPC domain-containing protein n=1 Tax=Thalassoroseus pseudoceratinae TaxID=2713176 RepID=UPI001422A8BB|nr:PPC domain-containing protein [Thalassoroseus pseudoceratinae]
MNQLEIGEEVDGRISSYGEVDRYRVNLTAGQTYVFQTEAGVNVDLKLRLFEPDGSLIIEDRNGGPNLSSRIEWTPEESGDFELAVTGAGYFNTGSYELLASEVDPSTLTGMDRFPDARSLAIGAIDYATLGFGSAQRVYQLETTSGDSYSISVKPQPSYFGTSFLGVSLTLYAANGKSVLAIDEGNAVGELAEIDFVATASEPVYLVVRPTQGFGAATVTVNELEIGREIQGRISAGEVDRYRVNLTSGRTYVFQTEANANVDLSLQLFDSEGSLVVEDHDGGRGLSPRIEWTAQESGEYELAVKGASYFHIGDYALLASDVDPLTLTGRDRFPDARLLSVDSTELASLSFGSELLVYQLDTASGDSYAISVKPQPSLFGPSSLGVSLTLYTADGKSVLVTNEGNAIGETARIDFKATTSEPVYLAVAPAQGYGKVTINAELLDVVVEDQNLAGAAAEQLVGGLTAIRDVLTKYIENKQDSYSSEAESLRVSALTALSREAETLIESIKLENVNTSADLRAALETAGLSVDSLANDQQLAKIFLSGEGVLVEVGYSNVVDIAEDEMGFRKNILPSIDNLPAINFPQDMLGTGEFRVDLRFGLDADGWYMLPGTVLDGIIAASSATKTSRDDSASSADFQMQTESRLSLTTVRGDGRVRLEDLGTTIDALTIEIEGHSEIDLTTELRLPGLDPINARGNWVWTLDAHNGYELKSEHSGFDDAGLLDSLTVAIMDGIHQFGSSAQVLADRLNALDFIDADSSSTITNGLTRQFSLGDAETSIEVLQSIGFTVQSAISSFDLFAYSFNGGVLPQDLLVLQHQGNRTQQLTFEADDTTSFGVNNSSIEASISGNIEGDADTTTDLRFGLESSGQFFVQEGGRVGVNVAASGNLDGQAKSGKSISGSLAAEGELAADVVWILDDGDAIESERLYLASTELIEALANADSVTVSGQLNLNELRLTLNVPGLPQNATAVELEGTGTWNLADESGEFQLDSNALINSLASDVVRRLDEFANRADSFADKASGLPLVGPQITTSIQSLIDSTLRFNLPEEGILPFLESRGLTVATVVSPEELLSGNVTDLITLEYSHSETPEAWMLGNSTALDAANGIGFDLQGELTAQPSLDLQLVFGLDTVGGIYVQEGSSAELSLTVDTSDTGLTAEVEIPGLTSVHGTVVGLSNQHVADAGFSLVVNDFDSTDEERLYLYDETEGGLILALENEQALSLQARADLLATLSIENPLSNLPRFVTDTLPLDTITGIPQTLEWMASLHYDAATDEFSYTLDGNDWSEIIGALQNSESLQDALFQVMIDQFAENNPIPKSVQEFFGKKLGFFQQNILDLLDVPEAAQFVLAPEAFRGQTLAQIQSESGNNDQLSLQFELFSPSNIEKFLTGQPYDIFSLDVDQTFESSIGEITALPETTLFSYFGIVNIELGVTLEPSIEFGFDFTVGLDTEGFYLEENDIDGVSNPHITFGGGITGNVAATGNLFVVLDLVEVTADVGLDAFGGFTFNAPESSNDSKVRPSDIIEPDNIDVSVGLDLDLGLQGEVGIVDANIVLQTERLSRVIPLYRNEAGTLSDIQDRLQEFKDEFESTGKEAIFLAAKTGKPQIVAAAAYLLYQETQSYVGTAVQLVREYEVDLVDVAKALSSGLNANLKDVAAAVYAVNQDLAETASILYQHVTSDLSEIAKALFEGTQANNVQILDAIKDGILRELAESIGESIGNWTGTGGQRLSHLDEDLRQQVRTAANDIKAIIKSIDVELDVNLSQLDDQAIDLLFELRANLFGEVDQVVSSANQTIKDIHQKYSQLKVESFRSLVDAVGQAIAGAQKLRDDSIETVKQTIASLNEKIDDHLQDIKDAIGDFEDEKARIDAEIAKRINSLPWPLNRIASELDRIRREGESLIKSAREARDKLVKDARQQIEWAQDQIDDRRAEITAFVDQFINDRQMQIEQIANFDWEVDASDYSLGDWITNEINIWARDFFEMQVRDAIQENPARDWRAWIQEKLGELYEQQGIAPSPSQIQSDIEILDNLGWISPLESHVSVYESISDGLDYLTDGLNAIRGDESFHDALDTVEVFLTDLESGTVNVIPDHVIEALEKIKSAANFLTDAPFGSGIGGGGGIGWTPGISQLPKAIDAIQSAIEDVINIPKLLSNPAPSTEIILEQLADTLVFEGPGQLDAAALSVWGPGQAIIDGTIGRITSMSERFARIHNELRPENPFFPGQRLSLGTFTDQVASTTRRLSERILEIGTSWGEQVRTHHEDGLRPLIEVFQAAARNRFESLEETRDSIRRRLNSFEEAFHELSDDEQNMLRQELFGHARLNEFNENETISAGFRQNVEGILDNFVNYIRKTPETLGRELQDIFYHHFGTEPDFSDSVIKKLRAGDSAGAARALIGGVLYEVPRDRLLYGMGYVVDSVIDTGSEFVGLFYGRKLTAAEQEAAKSIFHDQLPPLDEIRVVETPFEGAGMVGGLVIFIGSEDPLQDLPLFAHELTHIYQDHHPQLSGTLGATKEQIHSLAGGPDPYEYQLTPDTDWYELGMEQQAEIVETWQSHLEAGGTNSTTSIGSIPDINDVHTYWSLLTQAGLF